MGDYSLGSVVTEVHKLINSIPTGLSGTNMHATADRKRQTVADAVGTTIGSNSIPIKYQDPIILLTAATVAKSMVTFGLDAGRVRLGDLTVDSGGRGSNPLIAVAENFEKQAKESLKSLGYSIRFFKALG